MFDTWKDSLKRGLDGLKDKAEDIQESMRLKSAIAKLNDQKVNHLLRLGALTYHSLRNNQPLNDLAAAEVTAILELDMEIAPLKRQLTLVETDGKSPCPSCQTMVEQTATYCGQCGTDLAKAWAAQPVCHACKALLGQSDRFCGDCGSAVGGAA